MPEGRNWQQPQGYPELREPHWLLGGSPSPPKHSQVPGPVLKTSVPNLPEAFCGLARSISQMGKMEAQRGSGSFTHDQAARASRAGAGFRLAAELLFLTSRMTQATSQTN